MKRIIIFLTALMFAMGNKIAAQEKATSVNQSIPGVTEEISADGVKTVTINLSEIDESKLPERYEAEVILEAPIVMGEQNYVREDKESYKYNRFEEVYNGIVVYLNDGKRGGLTGKSATPSGVFLTMPEGGPHGGFDVSIDEEGNIYILDLYNSRIQKFNNKGEHKRDIVIKEGYKGEVKKIKERIGEEEYIEREKWVIERNKGEIEARNGKVYVRDIANNSIEVIDESGAVLEKIDIPETIEGKSTRGMYMWVDDEGVGVGEKRLKKENGKLLLEKRNYKKMENGKWVDENKINQKINISIINNIINFKQTKTNIKIGNSVIAIYKIGKDRNKNIYFKISAGSKKERGILKVSENGQIRMFINDSPFWWDDKWKNGCDKIEPFFNGDYIDSILFSKNGTLYLIQSFCCQKGEECVSKIRVIALKNK